MVSEPRLPELRTDDGARLGRAIRDRFRPNFVLAAGDRRHTRPGTLMRSTRTFGMRLALSQQNRHRIDAQASDTPMSTRPPIDYWPWPEPDEQQEDFQPAARRRAAAAAATSTAPKPQAQRTAEMQVDVLRQFVQRKAAGGATPFGALANTPAAPVAPAGAAASAAPRPSSSDAVAAAHPGRVRRGLPITARRKGRTWAGPKTSPGGMARDAAPQPTTSVAHNRWAADAPEPLPEVVSSGVIDSAPVQRSGRSPAVPPASREDQLRRLLEKSGQVPAQSVSADDLAASLSRADSPRPAPSRTAPNASIAERTTPARPGGTLARVVADGPAAQAAAAPSSQRPLPTRTAESPSALAASADVRTASPPDGRPVSADMLRRLAASPVGARTEVHGVRPAPARSGSSAPSVSSSNSEGSMVGHRPGVTTREPLDGGARALPLVATAPSAIAVMERVQRVTSDVDVEHESVLPPRSFAGWESEFIAAEPEPTHRRSLPLASVRRQLRAHIPELLTVTRDADVGRAPTVPPAATTPTATSAPSTTAPSTTAPSTAATTARAATSTGASLRSGVVAGQAMAVTAAGLARSLRIDPTSSASTIGLQRVAASPRRHRRTVARSLDGRGVQWVDHPATTADDIAPSAADPVAAIAVARAGDTSSRTAGAAARPGEARLGALAQTGNEATLRRALLAVERSVATTDDLVVAPPAMGHLGDDVSESPDTASAQIQVSGQRANREPSPITSDTIRRTMQSRLAEQDAPRRIDRPGGAETVTSVTAGVDRRRVAAPATEHATATDTVGSAGSADGAMDARTGAARVIRAVAPLGSPASAIEIADRLVDVDAASVTSARLFVDRAGDTSAVDPTAITSSAATTTSAAIPTAATTSSAAIPTAAATSSAAVHRDGTNAASSNSPASVQPSSGPASVADVRRSVVAKQPAERWVPADPGTLFSSLTGRGVLQRRSLLTLSEASIAAATRSPFTAGPPSQALLQRTMFPDSLAQHDASEQWRGDARTASPAEPLSERVDRAVAPRSLQRSVDPLIDAAAAAAAVAVTAGEGAPAKKPRKSRAKQSVQPLVDPAELAVAPRPVQRSTENRPDPTNGAARVAAVDLADRFLAELSRHRQERPKPLPIQFASIADLIVGKRTPLVSTGEASQRALAAVNKVAATTGDVIHLADPLRLASPDAEMRGIIAHELTHVAAPSPAPRFFDDDRHTAEEHRATEIGELMRHSLAPPSGSGSVRGGSMSITQESTRSAARDSSGNIRREMDSSSRQSAGSPTSWSSTPSRDSSGTVRRALAMDEMTTTTTHSSDGPTADVDSPVTKASEFTAMLRDNFDLIVELLEDRIISDIERRGGRYRGDF